MGRQFMTASMLSMLAMSSGAVAVVQMGVKRVAPVTDAHLRSRSTVTSTLQNNVTGGSYMISTEVGTPAQPLSLVLDTGSSDVFVLSSKADQCTAGTSANEEYGPCVGGTYNNASSSTYSFVSNDFSIQYQDQSGSTGDYFTDTFALGSSTVTKLQMGLALKTTVGVGIMGVGYDTNEASRSIYPSVIDQMVTQGVIPIKAYSLYLDDLQSSSGSILFGGIDTAKYNGNLIALPVQKDTSGGYSSFTVALTSVGMTSETGTNTSFTDPKGLPAAVVLDSGTTLSYLPDAVCSQIYKAIGADDQSQQGGNVLVDCSLATSDSKVKINYGFGGTGGPQISVDMSELVFPMESVMSGGSAPAATKCAFGIMPAGDSSAAAESDVVFLLGDTFLRSAYVVYDITNNQVALAPSSFNQTGSNVQEISSSATSIPAASGVAGSVTVQQSGTGIPGVGTQTSSKAAAAGPIPAFQASGLIVLCISGLMAVAGSTWFLI